MIGFIWKNVRISLVASIALSPVLGSQRGRASEFYEIAGQGLDGTSTEVNGISDAGDIAAGTIAVGGSLRAFVWTVTGGLQLIDGSRQAFGVSGDGQVVVGDAIRPATGIAEPFRWTSTTGLQWLGSPPGSSPDFATAAYSSSWDGSVVVGETKVGPAGKAFRWTAAGGVQLLDSAMSTLGRDSARAVSDDGAVIAGDLFPQVSSNVAFRWTSQSGIVPLGDLSGGTGSSFAGGISPDGSVIVGQASSPSGPQAFMWTETSGMVGLAEFVASPPSQITPSVSFAFDATRSGEAIVGTSSAPYPYPTSGGGHAFVWTAARGMESLHLRLENGFGLGAELSGWRLTEARAISPDGRAIAGVGFNPDGNIQGWLVRLDAPIFVPEPRATGLFAAAMVVPVIRRRWQEK